jgi:hypothetical protein
VGALIVDDPLDTLMAIAAKAYAIYHTVAFIESNTTQSYFPRELQFYQGSSNLAHLQGGDLFGPQTIVTVDYYFDSLDLDQNSEDPLVHEHMQHEMIAPRWKTNGMQPNDIGVVMELMRCLLVTFSVHCRFVIFQNSFQVKTAWNPRSWLLL